MDLGAKNPREGDKIQHLITLRGALCAFSTERICQISTADDVDPDRTALDTRHAYQEIYSTGCGSPYVARSIIQAKQILDGVVLAPGIEKDQVVEAIWGCTETLLRCETARSQILGETTSLMAECDRLINSAKASQSIPSLPQVSGLEEVTTPRQSRGIVTRCIGPGRRPRPGPDGCSSR
jgi:hypothetical protein